MAKGPYKASQELFMGAIILSIAAVFVKIMSAAYRIPYQNITGDIGFYIYQQVYPFYGIAITLSTVGFPLIISKLMVEGKYSVRDIFQASILVLGSLGLLMFSGLFYFSDWIASEVMSDPHLGELLRWTSFSYLLMPMLVLLRGFFQGSHTMVPTAVSQVVEQFVRVTCIIVFVLFLINHGYSLYDAGKGAVLASILGSLAGILLLIGFFIIGNKQKSLRQHKRNLSDYPIIIRVLLLQGIAFCMSSLILILLQLIDSINVYSLLISSGMDEQVAKAWKGVYDRGQPLLQLGTVVANSFALALVPFVTSYMNHPHREELVQKVKFTMRVSLTIGLAATAGLISIIRPVNLMLYTDENGTIAIAIFSISIVFSSLIMTLATVAQSLGKSLLSFFIVLFGLLCKWSLNEWLIPIYHINGAALATVLSLLMMMLCFYFVVCKEMKSFLFSRRDFLILGKAIVIMGLVLHFLNICFQSDVIEASRVMATVHSLVGVFVGAIIFIAVILRQQLFMKEELLQLPKGELLIRFQEWKRS